jgi:hypothetical protein
VGAGGAPGPPANFDLPDLYLSALDLSDLDTPDLDPSSVDPLDLNLSSLALLLVCFRCSYHDPPP